MARITIKSEVAKFVHASGCLMTSEAYEAIDRAVVGILDRAIGYTKPQKKVTAKEIQLACGIGTIKPREVR